MFYGYARVSTTHQGATIPIQLAKLEKVAMEMGEPFTPLEEKGSAKNVEGRPVFLRLLSTLKKGDYVGVYDPSRLTRDAVTDNAIALAREIEKRGAHLVVGDKVIDTNDPYDQLSLGVQSVMDSVQRTIGNNKSKSVLDEMRRNGYWVYTSAMFGWETYKQRGVTYATIDEPAAQRIRYIFKEYANGRSATSLSKELDGTFVTKHSRFCFTTTEIQKMIRRPVYMGYTTTVKTTDKDLIRLTRKELEDRLVKSKVYQPIIDEELWWRCFESYRTLRRKHSRKYEKRFSYNELSGLFRCPHCNAIWGHNMRGGVEFYGPSAHPDICKDPAYRAIRKTLLETITRATLYIVFSSDEKEVSMFFKDKRERLELSVKDEQIEAEELVKELERLHNGVDKLTDLYMDGLLSKEDYKRRKGNSDEEIEKREKRLKSLEKSIAISLGELDDILKEVSQDLLDEIVNETVTNRRGKIYNLLDHGHIVNERIDIEYLNHKSFSIELPKKKMKHIDNLKMTVSFNGEEQFTATVSDSKPYLTIHHIDFDEDTMSYADKPFIDSVNSHYDDLSKKTNEWLERFNV